MNETKRVGHQDLAAGECGFSLEIDTQTCSEPSELHGIVAGTWEDTSFLTACAEHGPALETVADYTHVIQDECLVLDAYWLTRWDGGSFCYHPEDEAALRAELARPEIAWSAKP